MTLSVLLADSSDSVKKALELGLRDYKTTVTKVTSNILEEAIKLNPNIIFVDVLLEHEDGYTVSEKIKSEKLLENTKVVIMTSSFLKLDEARFLQSKADANLKKPFDIKSLKEIMKNLFNIDQNPIHETTNQSHTEHTFSRPQNIDDFSNVPLSSIGSRNSNHPNLKKTDFSLDKSYRFENNSTDCQKPPDYEQAKTETLEGGNIFSSTDFNPIDSINDGLDANLDTRVSRDEQIEILENTTRDIVRKLLPNIVTRYVKEELRKLMADSKMDE